RVNLRIAGTTCPADFGNPPDFYRFNTDDQCSGNMELSETASGVQTFQVCQGAQTTVTFTDRTRINCLPPAQLTFINSNRRRRRFPEGNLNSITGAVLIGGVNHGPGPYQVSATPDVTTDGLTSENTPFANNTTLSITIPATAVDGQEFHILMEYWNDC